MWSVRSLNNYNEVDKEEYSMESQEDYKEYDKKVISILMKTLGHITKCCARKRL